MTNNKENERSKIWASTMLGNVTEQVIRAHADPIAYVPYEPEQNVALNDEALFSAQARCDVEEILLSESATKSSVKGQRKHERIEHVSADDPLFGLNFRTDFERDRDRILHSQAFRRLAGKTQVHLNPDDHQRTRLTHALEVAQIARAIAKALRLNETLAEAIALGHDCGHGPGGHASEDAFDPFLDGGFDHAIFGADVTLRRLNLCEQTLDGIRNHSWSLNTPKTPEAEVVSFADRIAYVCHDAEDALSCSMISSRDFPKELSSFLSRSRGEQIDYFVRGVVQGTIASESIAIEKTCGEMLGAYRSFNHEYIYSSPRSLAQNQVVISTLTDLVEYYIDNFEAIPEFYRTGSKENDRDKTFAVVEYVAGMTDQYAYEKYKDLVK